jgi:hypothetical protein
MSNRHLTEVWRVPLPGREKLVLLAQADHACEFCGLAWPGLALLGEKTGVGKTGLREALAKLAGLGLLKQHAYGQGGRGCSTVYQVLPSLQGAVAPCPRCQANLRTPAAAVPRKPLAAETHRTGGRFPEQKPTARVDGFRNCANGNPPDVRAVSAIPTRIGPETHRTTNAASVAEPVGVCAVVAAPAAVAVRQPLLEPKPPTRASAREGQEAAAAPRAPIRPRHTPGSVAEILASVLPGLRVSPMLDGISAGVALQATPNGNPADRGEAQGPGRSRQSAARASPVAVGAVPGPAWSAPGARRDEFG